MSAAKTVPLRLCIRCNKNHQRSQHQLCSACRPLVLLEICIFCEENYHKNSPYKLCSKCYQWHYRLFFGQDMERRRIRDCVKRRKQTNERNKEKRRLGLDKPRSLKTRLANNIRARLGVFFKAGFVKKPGHMSPLLGCTWDDLKFHLERQFYVRSTGETMTWDNYGVHGWHIDHKQPLCSFDLESIEQCKKAVHFTNLQPLWCEDNLKKATKDRYLPRSHRDRLDGFCKAAAKARTPKNLQDPKDKRVIIPDATLSPIIGSEPINMMKLSGQLNKHFIK